MISAKDNLAANLIFVANPSRALAAPIFLFMCFY